MKYQQNNAMCICHLPCRATCSSHGWQLVPLLSFRWLCFISSDPQATSQPYLLAADGLPLALLLRGAPRLAGGRCGVFRPPESLKCRSPATLFARAGGREEDGSIIFIRPPELRKKLAMGWGHAKLSPHMHADVMRCSCSAKLLQMCRQMCSQTMKHDYNRILQMRGQNIRPGVNCRSPN